MPWKDFADHCRLINRHSLNNLCIVLASCFGFQALVQPDVVRTRDLAPACAVIGAPSEVLAGRIDDVFPAFYRALLFDSDWLGAMRSIASDYQSFNAEEMLLKSFALYVRTECVGRGRRERRERLLTQYLVRYPGRRHDIKRLRAQIKNLTAPSAETYIRYKDMFLMASHPANAGRFPSTFDDVLTRLEYLRSPKRGEDRSTRS